MEYVDEDDGDGAEMMLRVISDGDDDTPGGSVGWWRVCDDKSGSRELCTRWNRGGCRRWMEDRYREVMVGSVKVQR